MNLQDWINLNTKDSKTVVEFGAGFFDKLSFVSNDVKKIGIESWMPYIENSKYNECKKINGNFVKYNDLISAEDHDCAMFIDTLEHVNKDEAILLISEIKKTFNKIIVMIPEGEHKQDKDVTGFGAHELQTHRSYWQYQDFVNMNFTTVEVDKNFHAGHSSPGCIFAVWENK